jgi:putative redox protein
MEVTAGYLENSKFEVVARRHRVICDQPLENGGSDEGMSPPEFLLASLATCAAYYATQYMKTRGLPCDGLKVRVKAEKGTHPARLASFHIEVEAPGLTGRHRDGAFRAVKACLIHNTLLGSPRIEVSIDPPAIDSSRIVVGTDHFAAKDVEYPTAVLDQFHLPGADRERILKGNAIRLLQL